MKARVVAPARGVRWLFEGLRMFLAAPLGWLVLAFAYLMLTLLLTLVPVIGSVLSLMSYPAFTVGFMVASRAAALHQPLEIGMLFAGFQERFRHQAVLGGAYVLGILLAILGSSLADDGAVVRFVFTPPPAETSPQLEPGMRNGALMGMLLYAPTFMMMFFAPLLVAWHAVAPGKALFYSFFACVLNWRAFVTYTVVGLAGMFLLSNILLTIGLAFSGAETRANPMALMPLVLPIMFMLVWPVLMASVYASYQEVFAAAEDA